MKAYLHKPREVTVSGVSDRACRVYDVIALHADRHGVAFPSRETIAKWCNPRCSVRSVTRAVRELADAGFVDVERTRGGVSVYRLVGTRLSLPVGTPVSRGGDTESPEPVTPVSHEGEKFLKESRAPARAPTRAHAREDRLDAALATHALGLGELPEVMQEWNRGPGFHLAFDEHLYREELHAAFDKRYDMTPDLADRLLDDARTLSEAVA